MRRSLIACLAVVFFAAGITHAQVASFRAHLPLVFRQARPAPTPTTKPAPVPTTLQVANSRSWRDGTTLYIVGELLNSSNTPAYHAKVIADLHNAAGLIVAREDAYAVFISMPPGSRNPFKISISNVPADTARYRLSGEYSTPTFTDYRYVTVLSQKRRNNAGVEIVGEVRDDHLQAVSYVRVGATFYNAANNVVDVGWSYVSKRDLAPGEISSYAIRTFEDFSYARVDVRAEGWVGDSAAAAATPEPDSRFTGPVLPLDDRDR